jgi:predicted Zn-dependent protease
VRRFPGWLRALLLLLCLSACRADFLGSFLDSGGGYQELTPEQEYYLGRTVAAHLFSRYPASRNRAAAIYLNRLGQALALYSTHPVLAGYHFQLLDTAEINSFSTPGGFVFLTRGMLGLLSGEGELAAVLAHEIAHVQNRDGLRAIQSARRTEASFDSRGSVSLQQNLVSSDDVRVFSDSVNSVVAALTSAGYPRDREYAADASAGEILQKAGYDPRSLEAVLRTLQRRMPEGGLGRTHPEAAKRLEALRASGDRPAPEPKARAERFRKALAAYVSR